MKQFKHSTAFFLLLLSAFFISINNSYAAQDAKAFPSLAPMLSRVMPAIVNIAAQGTIPATPNFDDDRSSSRKSQNKANKPRKFESIGSGVIIQPSKGYILTNNHVIKNADTITVTLNDGRRLKAKLIGADSDSDIAVIQVKSKNLKTIPLANSTTLHVGDFVVAIGNPFGLSNFGTNQTATFGIVSALQRNDLNIEGVENFIQTDAAINPGNSGGALINMQGQLIGINTAIISPYGGNIGIGFAIPINMARQVMEQLIKYGSIRRGVMGIYVQHLTPELADAFKISNTKGALVTQVNIGSPAAKAGLHPGDVIQDINGATITDSSQVKNIVGLLRVGSKVQMKVLRKGQQLTLTAVIADAKHSSEQLASKNPYLFGLALRDFNEDSPLHGQVSGVQIVGASESSAGWRAGLRPGDVIVAANQESVGGIQNLKAIADNSKSEMLIHILRGPGSLFFVVK